MSIITTVGALLGAEDVLARLREVRLSAKAAYQLAKLLKLAAEELAIFHQEREKAIKDWGEAREPTAEEAAKGWTTTHQVKPEHLSAFHARMVELAAVEVTLPVDPLSLSMLDCVDLSADDVLRLGPLVGE